MPSPETNTFDSAKLNKLLDEFDKNIGIEKSRQNPDGILADIQNPNNPDNKAMADYLAMVKQIAKDTEQGTIKQEQLAALEKQEKLLRDTHSNSGEYHYSYINMDKAMPKELKEQLAQLKNSAQNTLNQRKAEKDALPNYTNKDVLVKTFIEMGVDASYGEVDTNKKVGLIFEGTDNSKSKRLFAELEKQMPTGTIHRVGGDDGNGKIYIDLEPIKNMDALIERVKIPEIKDAFDTHKRQLETKSIETVKDVQESLAALGAEFKVFGIDGKARADGKGETGAYVKLLAQKMIDEGLLDAKNTTADDGKIDEKFKTALAEAMTSPDVKRKLAISEDEVNTTITAVKKERAARHAASAPAQQAPAAQTEQNPPQKPKDKGEKTPSAETSVVEASLPTQEPKANMAIALNQAYQALYDAGKGDQFLQMTQSGMQAINTNDAATLRTVAHALSDNLAIAANADGVLDTNDQKLQDAQRVLRAASVAVVDVKNIDFNFADARLETPNQTQIASRDTSNGR